MREKILEWLQLVFVTCVIVWGISLHGCAPSSCPDLDGLAHAYGMDDHYDVRPTIVTPDGVQVDPSGYDIDPDAVDCLVRHIEQCLYDEFGDGSRIVYPINVRGAAYCVPSVDYPVSRDCMVIKIADDWSVSPCTGQQLLPWLAPDSACEAKGHTPTAECPCHWRAGVQDGHAVITTPNWYVAPDWIIRVYFGCQNPWGNPRVAKCAAPVTLVGDMTLTCSEN